MITIIACFVIGVSIMVGAYTADLLVLDAIDGKKRGKDGH